METITFRKMLATEALKKHASDQVKKITKLLKYEVEIHITLSTEKLSQCVELVVHAEHRDIVAVAMAEDMYQAIDLAVKKATVQLRKERDIKKAHGRREARKSKDELLPHQGKR